MENKNEYYMNKAVQEAYDGSQLPRPTANALEVGACKSSN